MFHLQWLVLIFYKNNTESGFVGHSIHSKQQDNFSIRVNTKFELLELILYTINNCLYVSYINNHCKTTLNLKYSRILSHDATQYYFDIDSGKEEYSSRSKLNLLHNYLI